MTGIIRKHLPILLLGLMPFSGPAAAQPAAEDPFRLDGVARIVAIADIHGAYEPFVRLLRGTALVNANLQWTGAATHLVIVGDVLDRGAESRRVLDLVMQLEQQAASAGGAVHMVLGNHEIMNLTGELAYVSREEFAAYRDLDDAGLRRDAQDRFEERAGGMTALQLRTAFSRQYPRGFFGHRVAFAPDGVYGRWLLRQPVLLVINDTAFVHAGLSAGLIEGDLATINSAATATLTAYLDDMQALMDADVLFPETDFHNQAELAENFIARPGRRNEPALLQAATELLELRTREPLGLDSSVWYRGMVDCSPALEYGRLRMALEKLGVARLVIGHTPTRDHMVQQRFDSRLVMADTGMLAEYYAGQPAAVIIEGAALSVFYADIDAVAPPSPQPRLVGARPVNMDDDKLEVFLETAPATLRDGGGGLLLQTGDVPASVHFSPAMQTADGQSFMPQVAAYRLDRLLELDIVPVAVVREVDGVTGAVYASALPATQSAPNVEADAWCPVPDQLGLVAIFDALIGHPSRTPDQQHWTSGNWKLALPGISTMLDDAAAPLPALERPIPPYLADKLAGLNSEVLEAELGDVLDAQRRQLLLQRRDQLLNATR